LVAEDALGVVAKAEERGQVLQHPPQAHDREFCEGVKQLGPGSRHFRTAEAVDVDVWIARPERANQVRTVEITARFPDAEEQVHAGILASGG
jgi:hypothetical protein